MTSKITVTASCADNREVKVNIIKGDDEDTQHTLQNGETNDFYVYDNREVTVFEVKK